MNRGSQLVSRSTRYRNTSSGEDCAPGKSGYRSRVTETPLQICVARRDERRAERQRLERRDRALSTARLVAFGIGFVVVVLAVERQLHWAWTAVPLALFVSLVVAHARALDRRRRVARQEAFWERGAARIEGRWAGQPGYDDGARFLVPTHPYAADLDLFGKASLFERISSARTAAGEACLAEWLASPASAEEARARQAAVRALLPRTELREALAVVGAEVRAEVEPERILKWAEEPPAKPLLAGWLLPTCVVLATAAVAVTGWWAWSGDWRPYLPLALVEAVVWVSLGKALKQVNSTVRRPAAELEVLAAALALFEVEPSLGEGAPVRLATLRARLYSDGQRASEHVAVLRGRLTRLNWQYNQFFAIFGFFLMWGPMWASLVERWRLRRGADLHSWLSALAELEALTSLAGFAWERPEDCFPEITDGPAPRFVAEALGHPLIGPPEERCIRNDVAFDHGLQLMMVSGSNMSGKSTLLRSAGTAVALALAGAPVRAKRLSLSPLQLGATLRVQDSLQEGASRFYAEITRLRAVVELSHGTRPLFFLLDEILSGTNSHDRRLGAEAVVKNLVAAGAIGFCTTHDLALTEVVPALGVAAINVHFEDQVDGDKLVFDYRMQPGVVRRSNAIALMRAVGLPV